jgi:hypothetical protein
MDITGKAERTQQSDIEQSMPIFNSKPTQLEKYINGWRTHDTEAILATLTSDCVVIESFGPIYHGHAWVSRWISAWLA